MNADTSKAQGSRTASFKRASSAFTLIEILVVIAIIGILAALILNLLPRANDMKVRTRVKAELAQMETAISSYQVKRGFLPPDNPANPGSNSLFYELSGATLDKSKNEYITLNGEGPLATATLTTAFNAGGIVNANSAGGADDAQNFHPSVKMGQQARDMNVNGVTVKLLGVATKGPAGDFCPWFYNSSNPVHNHNGFDLWVEVTLGGKTQTFGNWRQN